MMEVLTRRPGGLAPAWNSYSLSDYVSSLSDCTAYQPGTNGGGEDGVGEGGGDGGGGGGKSTVGEGG